MTYNEAVSYIHSVSWLGSKPGLDRIKELCSLLNNPQNNLKFIHIAGTNGKGSTSTMLSSILIEAGHTVGTFTSPYVYSFNERISVNGENISDEALAQTVEEVKKSADKMADSPTEFELITAIGFVYFNKKNCDTVVLECGMGGRLDSTNIISSSLLSVITGVDLDHTSFLGDTPEKIAFEKAGIIKEGCPVIFGKCPSIACDNVIISKAVEMKSDYSKVDYGRAYNIIYSTEGISFNFKGYEAPFEISLIGSYQVDNASLVISACEILGISEKYIYRGLKKARWRGRFEKLSSSPLIFFDGGHNPQGVNAAVDTVNKIIKSKVAVITGVMEDKNYRAMAKDISTVSQKVFCVSPDNPRALDAKKYAEVFKEYKVDAVYFSSVNEALKSAIAYSKAENIPVLGLGSLYMYKEFYDAVFSREVLSNENRN